MQVGWHDTALNTTEVSPKIVWPGNSPTPPCDSECDVLKIGVLVPVSGSWAAGRTIAGAASLAVDTINRDAAMLVGRRLEFVWRDSVCSSSQALVALSEMIAESKVDAVIGPACDEACESTAHFTAGQNLLQVG